VLATLHNLHHYLQLMRRIRRAILEGRFPEVLASIRSAAETAADVE
jgi:tRNA-guanine family transglycosylase